MKKMMGKTLSVTVPLTLLTLGSGLALAADAAQEPVQEIVITANRLKNTKADTPANVTVITAQQIKERGYENVAEALEDVSGARVMQGGIGAGERHVMLNGDERVLVLVDGRRVNNSMGSMVKATLDLNTLPPMGAIEKIEVVKGGASTLYGADAVGGVINIITKNTEETTGTLRAGYGSWGNQDLGVTVSGRQDKTGILVSAQLEKASYTKYKDHNGDTKRWPGRSDYTQDALSLKVTQDFDANSGLTLNYDYSNLEGNNPYQVNYYSPSQIDKKTNNVGLRYDWNRNLDNKGYVQLYRNYYSYYNLGGMDETDWAVEAQQNLKLAENNTLIAGLEYRHAQAENIASYTGTQGYNNKALFVQDQWQFLPSWQLNAGVRYDDHSHSGNRTTGSVSVNKKFSQDSNLYVSWNQVFRTPTIDDLYYYSDLSLWGWGKYVGKDNLKAETGNVWNIGYNFKATPKTDVSINAFYSLLNNAIEWREVKVNEYRTDSYAENIQKEKKRGLELSAVHHLNKHWDLEGSYTYVKVEDNRADAGYTRDNNYAPNYYQFGVRFHDLRWNLSLRGRAATGLSRKNYGEDRYLTMDFNARYKFNQNWTCYATVYNLTNAAYAEQGGVVGGQDSYPMPGRRIMVGAEYSF